MVDRTLILVTIGIYSRYYMQKWASVELIEPENDRPASVHYRQTRAPILNIFTYSCRYTCPLEAPKYSAAYLKPLASGSIVCGRYFGHLNGRILPSTWV